MADPWDANRPFQELVQRVQEIQDFSTDGGRTIPDNDIVDTMYTIVYNTGLFYDDCDKWENKARTEKTGEIYRHTFRRHIVNKKGRKKIPLDWQNNTAQTSSKKLGRTPMIPSLTWQQRRR